MKIEESNVRCLKISDVEGLDLITVYLEDFEQWKGKITVECYGESWSSYWGSMGKNISDFFCSCDHHYLMKNLAGLMDPEIVDVDQILIDAQEKDVSLFDEENPTRDHDAMYELYGSDWDYGVGLPTTENVKYSYIMRIITAVKEALKEQDDNS